MRIQPILAVGLLLSAVLSLSSCSNVTEGFTLDFPSRDTFIRTSTVEVYTLPVAEGDFGSCPRFLSEVEGGTVGSAESSGSASVCEFRDGAVTLPDVPQGAVAYIAVARGEEGNALLTGCTIRNVYLDEQDLVIPLSPTSFYRMEFGTAEPETCTAEEKCQGRCR